MIVACPSCQTNLQIEPELAGSTVRCPACNSKLQIPADFAEGEANQQEAGGGDLKSSSRFLRQRKAWEESDPTNPNALLAFGIGMGITTLFYIAIFPFAAPHDTPAANLTGLQKFVDLFYKHFTISFANTLFFFWGSAICALKWFKLKHQYRALLLDVLPMELGREIDGSNVGDFIDHIYRLPAQLRDSMMVNRIRKALELFEVRQNVSHVAAMMSSQSAIDSSRIMGSYILTKAFLWAIPLLGFIGTVIGLSQAISGMQFGNVEDVSAIVNSIGVVTGGLGTAFDATLLGLVFAVILNFPLAALVKHEEECLNDIDAFCNEVVIPRLNDKEGAGGGDVGAVGETVARAITFAQDKFLDNLNTLSGQLLAYTDNLDRRQNEAQTAAIQQFSTNMSSLKSDVESVITDSIKRTTFHLTAVENGIEALNDVLNRLGEKQIVIQQTVKKGWFSK